MRYGRGPCGMGLRRGWRTQAGADEKAALQEQLKAVEEKRVEIETRLRELA